MRMRMRKRAIAITACLAALLASVAGTAEASWDWGRAQQAAQTVPQSWDWGRQVAAAPSPTGPSARTPVNPKIVKGKAGEGFFDPTAPGYTTADPGMSAPAQTLAAAFDPAPYSSLRWATTPEDANGHPWICISNNANTTFQDIVVAWDHEADQLTYAYQLNGCQGWGNNEKIDIERGGDPARACAYVYKAWNASGLLTRVIVYLNFHYTKDGCTSELSEQAHLSTQHWKSQTIGLGLGNLQYGFADRPNWGIGVMDMSSESYLTPNPERGDGLTYDWYN
jgi:hypothetical protein